MTRDELLSLPVTFNAVPTASNAYGISENQAYRLIKSGQFPVPVLSIGRRWVVTRAALLAALGVEEGPSPVPASRPPTPLRPVA